MEFVFKDLKSPHAWAWAALIACGISLAILCLSPILSRVSQGWVALGAYVCLVIFFWPSILRAAHQDHRHLLTVCIWTFVIVIAGIATSFYVFFALTGAQHAKYDKLLNVVPVFVAIWAAAVGWLIHFKLTTKAHRTNNAFSIIMETRKSAEYLRRAELTSKHFPPGMRTIPPEYHPFFPADSLSRVLNDPRSTEADREKAEAVLALKYVLNYFEFMAVGIRAGDLDETMVYDTISTSVIALFERGRPLAEYLGNADNGGGNALTYCELRSLVARWKQRQAEITAGTYRA